MREQNLVKYTTCVANIYEETAQAIANENQKFQKVYTNLNTMLEECYFVGSTKFGHNFIA